MLSFRMQRVVLGRLRLANGADCGSVLSYPGTDCDGGLDASQERGGVDEELVILLSIHIQVAGAIGEVCCTVLGRSIRSLVHVLAISSMQDACDPVAQYLRLDPSAIGQWGVVGCGRGQMPLLISSIKSGAMAILVSVCLQATKSERSLRPYRAMKTMAGGCPMSMKQVGRILQFMKMELSK